MPFFYFKLFFKTGLAAAEISMPNLSKYGRFLFILFKVQYSIIKLDTVVIVLFSSLMF